MATTSLWHIKGRLSDLIAYVENPEKTAPKGTEDFFNVFSYIQNPQKTADGSLVTAINCLKQTALQQMILTKQRYGKKNNYIAWHGYQSFKPRAFPMHHFPVIPLLSLLLFPSDTYPGPEPVGAQPPAGAGV